MSVNEKMTELADVLREKSGQTGKLSIDGMIAAAQSIESGGASIETCTVTITPSGRSTVSYVNNGQIVTESFNTTKVLTVTKNTIIAIKFGWSDLSAETGSCSKLFYSASNATYAISGDCQLVGASEPA